jgi:RNA polymerase sigma-70 factor (ECF subfamily)
MFESNMTFAGTESETQQIAHGLRARDITLLHGLVSQYQHRLVRYFIYLLGRRDPVDDLVQETWLRVLERGHSYDGQSRFEPWLFTVARNLAMDYARKRKLFSLDSHALDKNDSDGTAHEAHTPVSSRPSPFELAARTEDAQRLALCLQNLDPLYREALVLRFQEDLSLQEMADVIGTSVSTVSSRVYRGLAVLRAEMGGVGHAG